MGAVTLTSEQMPSHYHSVAVDVHSNVSGAPNITSWHSAGDQDPSLAPNSTYSTGGSLPHAHNLDGSVGNGSSLPPYYSLALIMRIS